jgi:hypothetical protein
LTEPTKNFLNIIYSTTNQFIKGAQKMNNNVQAEQSSHYDTSSEDAWAQLELEQQQVLETELSYDTAAVWEEQQYLIER